MAFLRTSGLPYKFFFLSIFLLLSIPLLVFTERSLSTKIAFSKSDSLNELKVNYEIWENNQSIQADMIYKLFTENAEAIALISQAWQSEDTDQRHSLLNQLQQLLEKEYEAYKAAGVLQYHFVFPDNTVFLRMHKPSKFGDNLEGIREDFVTVNRTFEIIRGFSEGRTAHAIRNIYPLFDAQNNHIGAMDIAYPSELFQKKMNDMSQIHTHFLVKKPSSRPKAGLEKITFSNTRLAASTLISCYL